MENRPELIRGLHAAMTGQELGVPGTRYSKQTSTLFDHILDGNQTKITEVAVEKSEYHKILSRRQTYKILYRKPPIIVKEVRLVEVDNMVPTGDTRILPVRECIIGTDENGVKHGYEILLFSDIVW